MRILLVEDDDRIAKPLVEDLTHQHHVVDWASDGLEAWDYVQATEYDLILLDVMLPRLDGISLCIKLRAINCQAQILMLTAKDTTSDKVIGLDAGADDYLVKPFELEELSARIRALSRRTTELKPEIIRQGRFCLQPSYRTVTYDDRELYLTPKEFMILECFLRKPNQVFTRQMLLDRLWTLDRASGEETVKTHITNIRRKLKQIGYSCDCIQTVYGVGYRFNADV